MFNELKNAYIQSWNFGNSCIEEGTDYKHLGVICDKYMPIDENVKLACNKLSGTFLSLVNCGIYEDGLNPVTSRRIYNSVGVTKSIVRVRIVVEYALSYSVP